MSSSRTSAFRNAVVGAIAAITALSVWIAPDVWRPVALSVAGGLHGLAWVVVEYLDNTRADGAISPRRGFTRLYFGLAAFVLLTLSQIWSTVGSL